MIDSRGGRGPSVRASPGARSGPAKPSVHAIAGSGFPRPRSKAFLLSSVEYARAFASGIHILDDGRPGIRERRAPWSTSSCGVSCSRGAIGLPHFRRARTQTSRWVVAVSQRPRRRARSFRNCASDNGRMHARLEACLRQSTGRSRKSASRTGGAGRDDRAPARPRDAVRLRASVRHLSQDKCRTARRRSN
jgi:hypothetical protein